MQTPLKKGFILEDALRLMNKCKNIGLSQKETTLAFAYSNHPVIDEIQERDNVMGLNFMEFQEFICRLA